MALEQTLSIIKPDAVGKNLIGEIYTRIEKRGFRIVAAKMILLSREKAGEFYAEHRGRPYYEPLVEFMTSGPIMVQVLEGEDIVSRYRELMGTTNSPEAAPGTIRRDLGADNRRNAVHGSDSPANARREITFFFNQDEVYSHQKMN